jgi:hypothetical protein
VALQIVRVLRIVVRIHVARVPEVDQRRVREQIRRFNDQQGSRSHNAQAVEFAFHPAPAIF